MAERQRDRQIERQRDRKKKEQESAEAISGLKKTYVLWLLTSDGRLNRSTLNVRLLVVLLKVSLFCVAILFCVYFNCNFSDFSPHKYKKNYDSMQNRLTFKSTTNSTTFKVLLFRGPSDIHHLCVHEIITIFFAQ